MREPRKAGRAQLKQTNLHRYDHGDAAALQDFPG